MVDKNRLSPLEQYQGFTKAFETYQEYLASENYIGAYVIAFSILEDRVNAMYITRHIVHWGRSPTTYHVHSTGFAKKVRFLERRGDIDAAAKRRWSKAAQDRNQKLHAAMWNIDAFEKQDAEFVLQHAREADRLRKAQKRKGI